MTEAEYKAVVEALANDKDVSVAVPEEAAANGRKRLTVSLASATE